MKYKNRLKGGKPIIFEGAATALITPFRDGSPDIDAFAAMIERQLDGGISALVVCGTTGESPTLTHDESIGLIAEAADIVRGRVPVIAGVGTNDTAKSAALAIEAAYAGADAVMAVTPYYNKTTDAGITAHFYAIADASPLPVIVYNVPSRTSVQISLSVYGKLARHENIVAVKEASGDAALAASLLHEHSDSLAVYSGCDEITLPLLSLGASGVISVVSNILPAETEALCRDFFHGDVDSARERQFYLLPLIKALFARPNPIPVKAACSALGWCTPDLRLPLAPLSDAETAEMLDLLDQYDMRGKTF